jgi:hypothetical protein
VAEIHEQLETEGIAKEDYAPWMRGPFAFPGRLYLTDRRLVFLQINPAFMVFGAAGAGLGVAKKPKKLRFDFPLGEIDVSKEKGPGLAKHVLAVSRPGGEGAKFTSKDCDAWVEAIRAAKSAGAPAG